MLHLRHGSSLVKRYKHELLGYEFWDSVCEEQWIPSVNHPARANRCWTGFIFRQINWVPIQECIRLHSYKDTFVTIYHCNMAVIKKSSVVKSREVLRQGKKHSLTEADENPLVPDEAKGRPRSLVPLPQGNGRADGPHPARIETHLFSTLRHLPQRFSQIDELQ